MPEIDAELKAHFIRLFQIALSDDEFSPMEWRLLYQFAEERSVPHEDLDRVLLSSGSKLAIPSSLEERVGYLHDLCVMIWADGEVNEEERYLLKKYCKQFEFQDENIEELAAFLLEQVRNGLTKVELIDLIRNA